MRCPDCNKFVGFDTDNEPELDLNVDDDGVVSGTARIVNCCAECGQELKEAVLDIEIDLTDEFREHVEQATALAMRRRKKSLIEHRPELLSEEGARSDRVQRTDRHGRAIKRSRYMKTFYGADVSVTIGCACQASGRRRHMDGAGDDAFEAAGTASSEVQASSMEELV